MKPNLESISKALHVNADIEILKKYNPPRGINFRTVRICDTKEAIAEWFTHAGYPDKRDRKYKEDIDNEISRLEKCIKIISDNTRSKKDYNLISNHSPDGKLTGIETILDNMENTDLDRYIDKATNKHKRKEDGKTWGKIF